MTYDVSMHLTAQCINRRVELALTVSWQIFRIGTVRYAEGL